MNHASKSPALPVLTVGLFQENGILIDNVFVTLALAADEYANHSKSSLRLYKSKFGSSI